VTVAGDRHEWLLGDGLRFASSRNPSAVALVDGQQTFTYEELLESSLRLARAFQDLGLPRGGRVVVHLPNGVACALAVFAAAAAGGVFVVVHPQTKVDKLRFLLEDSEASLLVTHVRDPAVLRAACDGVESLSAVLHAGGTAGGETPSLDEVLAAAPPEPERRAIPTDLAALVYTSGSTGRPKGVALTHGSMVFTAQSVSAYLGLRADDRIMNVLPLSFDYGLYQLLMSAHVGAALVLERGFSFPPRIVERARSEQVTVFPGVPTVYASLLQLNLTQPVTIPSVRTVTNTAAALPATFLAGLRRLFPSARIFAMYGLTECKRVAYLEPEFLDGRPTSVGKAIPGTEALVLRADGSETDADEIGVLHVRGPHVMSGYWRRPDLTDEMLRAGPVPGERMLCTHDLFRRDADGFLYFVGRTDDIIKSGGEKVSPLEIEQVVHAIPGVREAAVVGLPDPLLGEAVHAVVSLDAGVEIGEEEIRRVCRQQLEGFLVPARVHIVSQLPRSSNGKVSRPDLRELLDSAERAGDGDGDEHRGRGAD
jgi:long-chain acyl-CoA synthetase